MCVLIIASDSTDTTKLKLTSNLSHVSILPNKKFYVTCCYKVLHTVKHVLLLSNLFLFVGIMVLFP